MNRRRFLSWALRLAGATSLASRLGVSRLVLSAAHGQGASSVEPHLVRSVGEANTSSATSIMFEAGGGVLEDAQLVLRSNTSYFSVGPARARVRAPKRFGSSILGQDVEDVRMDSLEVDAAADAAAILQRTSGVTIRNCVFRDAPNDCLVFIDHNSDLLVEDVVCMGANATAGGGVASAGFEWADSGADATIRRLTSTRNVVGVAIHNHDHTAEGGAVTEIPTRLLVEDCDISGNSDLGLRVVKQASSPPVELDFRRCRFNDNRNDGIFIGRTRQSNHINGRIQFDGGEVLHNGRYAVNIEGDDVKLRNLLIVGGTRFFRIIDSRRVTIENCTIVADAATSYWLLYVWAGTGRTEQLTVRNCIFATLDSSVQLARIESSVPGLAVDHNLWVHPSPSGQTWNLAGTGVSFSGWQASGLDRKGTLSANAREVFADPSAGDYRLAKGSPAIGMADDGGNAGALGVV